MAMIDDETRAIIAGMKRARIPTKDIAKRVGLTLNQVTSACNKIGARACLLKGANPKNAPMPNNALWQLDHLEE